MLSWKGPQCGGERLNTLVVYDSKFGNTERVAQAMAERLQRHGAVELTTADRAPLTMPGHWTW